jgi:hypothetical protein
MSKALRITLMVIGILAVAGGLVFAGTWIGHRTAFGLGWSQPAYRMMNSEDRAINGNGRGMMNRTGGIGPGMMGGYGRGSGTGMMGNGFGSGTGMMGGYGYSDTSSAPLSVDQAFKAAETYLAGLNTPDLKIAEVMVFDNNAYVRVVEQSTGIGAFELLVNPVTLAVTPEPGPNMMWNLKYSAMNHQTMMGGRNGMMGGGNGMMGGGNGTTGLPSLSTPPAVSSEMTLTPAQGLQSAQQYLDTVLPGTKTAADADPFYGYYTIDILRDGKVVGMLSVNGFSSQVFLHTWHGTFISTQDY